MHRPAQDWRRWLALASLSIATHASGCVFQHARWTPLDRELSDSKSAIHTTEGRSIRGYTTADSVYHEFSGRVRASAGDSLSFLRLVDGSPGWPGTGRLASERMAAAADVKALRTTDTNYVGVAVTMLAVGVGFYYVAGIASIDSLD